MVLVMVVVVVVVVALASVSARIAYFASLEASKGQSEPHLRATAFSDRGVRQNDVSLEFGCISGQSTPHLQTTALSERGVRQNDVFGEFGGKFRPKYAPFSSHSAVQEAQVHFLLAVKNGAKRGRNMSQTRATAP